MSITEKQILAAEGDVLSGLLGEVLQPEKNKHNLRLKRDGGYSWDVCKKCNKETQRMGKLSDSYQEYKVIENETCPVSNPIPLNWDNAMKWRDWAVEKHGVHFGDVCITIGSSISGGVDNNDKMFNRLVNLSVFHHYAQSEHYLKAAALCKIGVNK